VNPPVVKPGLLIIVSGPAGSGKTTVCDRMLQEVPAVKRVVTSTTRPPRAGEKNGIDYYFFDPDTFAAKVAAGDFYEHAHVHTNRYGTLKSEIQNKIGAGTDLLLNVDVQGAKTFREAGINDPLLQGNVVSIFIMPPDIKELEKRLRHRSTDDSAEIQRRLKVAIDEMQQAALFDHTILTTTREQDFAAMYNIYTTEKNRR